ncbi:MAG: hypothetical protein OdinLCB4_005855 [Candidatus Odinarchaeum yellowstonii]|uniref:UBC core domain-containing protein n=1 Tax=Odinarchaeota yellowstonii (strain LCB_4) TaxID=1841599 RepID=A0AAF0D1R7_ODILC|nr:MAG: hypothetical protein OdinLCB4_005855 [Candidatus Odinarchaeum yellowstonii]
MYKMAPGFKTVNGDLRNWIGEIKFKSGRDFSSCWIEILLPENYPSEPPIVSCSSSLRHPIIDPATNRFNLRLLRNWNPNTHIYEIVNVIKSEFSRQPPEFLGALKPITKPSLEVENLSAGEIKELESKIRELESEVEYLRKDLAEKNDEIARLQNILSKETSFKDKGVKSGLSSLPVDSSTDLEGEKAALEGVIRDLEARFEAGDITPEEYFKLSQKYRKQLFLVGKNLSDTRKAESKN